jgi:hypothetical protein
MSARDQFVEKYGYVDHFLPQKTQVFDYLLPHLPERPFPRAGWQELTEEYKNQLAAHIVEYEAHTHQRRAFEEAVEWINPKLTLIHPPGEANPAWVNELYSLAMRDDPTEAINHLFAHIDRLIDAGSLDEIDELLSSAELDRLPVELQVGIVRVPFPAHRDLPAWKSTVYRVASHLEKAGRNAKQLLGGIL